MKELHTIPSAFPWTIEQKVQLGIALTKLYTAKSIKLMTTRGTVTYVQMRSRSEPGSEHCPPFLQCSCVHRPWPVTGTIAGDHENITIRWSMYIHMSYTTLHERGKDHGISIQWHSEKWFLLHSSQSRSKSWRNLPPVPATTLVETPSEMMIVASCVVSIGGAPVVDSIVGGEVGQSTSSEPSVQSNGRPSQRAEAAMHSLPSKHCTWLGWHPGT